MRTILAMLAVAGALISAPVAPAAADYRDADYWAFADRVAASLDDLWDGRRGRYRAPSGGVETMLNADLLLVHSAAALERHAGPARDDARARRLARALVRTPPYVVRPGRRAPGAHAHVPGWVSAMSATTGNQHLVIDAQVVDALVTAWRARRALHLSPALARRIARAVHRTARGRYWRWPAIRLNQINWYALVYAGDATVTGRRGRFRRDLRRQIERFTRGARARGGAAGNLGPGLRFHYLPQSRPSSPFNLDSAEYASIVASFARFYPAARAAGMARPSRLPLLRAWLRRVVCGYWTHSGYLNWDTGLSFRRWHQLKKLGLSQQALLGVASAPELQSRPAYGAWAKWLFDRGLRFYDRLARRSPGRIPPGTLFGLRREPQGPGSARLGASRMAANAARAVLAGLGRRRADAPPPLYAYDPDVGRLAVTTPAYSTAIVVVNQRAVPYGGIELARLLDGDGEVAAGIGGRPPAAFGLVVRDARGRPELVTQRGLPRVSRRRTPLRLTRAPAGVRATAASPVGAAYAGPFASLRATGRVVTARFAARTTHRFEPASITTTWSLRRRRAAGRRVADVLLPSWGRRATVIAVLRDGTRRRLGRTRVALAVVVRFEVRSARSGYVAEPLSAPAGATAALLHPRRQSSAPRPGPTLAIRIASGRFRRAALTVRLRID